MISVNDPNWKELAAAGWLVVRYTRQWLHYGTLGFTILCTLVAAAIGLAAQQ